MKTKKQLEAKLRKIKRQLTRSIERDHLWAMGEEKAMISLLKWILKSYSK